MNSEKSPWKEIIENEMIKRAKIAEGCIATIHLNCGIKTVFYCGRYIEKLPKKLKEIDPGFYDALWNEIFDEIHPY